MLTCLTVAGLVLLLVAVVAAAVSAAVWFTRPDSSYLDWFLLGQPAVEACFKLAGLLILAIIEAIGRGGSGS